MKDESDELSAVLRRERAELQPIAEPAELPAALERQTAAADALREYMAEKGNQGGLHTAPREQDQRNAVIAANQIVADIKTRQERARARIREIDRLLTSAAGSSQCRDALSQTNARIADAEARRDQFSSIVDDLENAVAELVSRRGNMLAQHGKDELAARLGGKSASVSAAKALASMDADIESRNAALAAARDARAEFEGTLQKLYQERGRTQGELRAALIGQADLDFYEALQTFLPIAARVVVSGSGLRAFDHENAVVVRCDDQLIRVARAAFNAELNGTEDGR